MFCSQCGKENKESYKFCCFCGAVLQKSSLDIGNADKVYSNEIGRAYANVDSICDTVKSEDVIIDVHGEGKNNTTSTQGEINVEKTNNIDNCHISDSKQNVCAKASGEDGHGLIFWGLVFMMTILLLNCIIAVLKV